ncbi:alpha/beta fold hydrolase [Caldimonas brevitalea]|uniref:Alpha/beta hydrolase n=1 Tax=Caldimonas brevitalea TaxID=413882 RepID=A0A0G3BH91_9BURK|nr:alpha/beta hydrolase [Caldimonas brevitalea]AKJ27333.1 alpha/beta hydrolase [Caldimonas brevitalea]
MNDGWFDGFEARHHEVGGLHIYARTGGHRQGPPVLLLHGFPQTHVMWHRVARHLAERFWLVMPDLRGYGDTDTPVSDRDHLAYSKRTMAADMLGLMRSLGHDRFSVVGHDRGGRVAHRLALDHPEAVAKLCVIDIAPTLDMYESTDMRFASAYYHWFHLIQPTPLPERMLGGDPRFYLHWTLGGWGATGLAHLESQALGEYERCFCRAESLHAICEDYRASAGVDLEHDRASRAAGQRVTCPLQLITGERGVVERLFDPVALWQAQCNGEVQAVRLPAGHFVPEEAPGATADALLRFL